MLSFYSRIGDHPIVELLFRLIYLTSRSSRIIDARLAALQMFSLATTIGQ